MDVRLARRAATQPASPIRRLAPFAAEARELGRHVFQLNIGQPDIPAPRAKLFDATLPPQPPVEDLLAAAESAMKKAAAHIDASQFEAAAEVLTEALANGPDNTEVLLPVILSYSAPQHSMLPSWLTMKSLP